MIPSSPFPVPRLAALARHAIPHLLETTLTPLGLFSGGLQLFGLWGALLAASSRLGAPSFRRMCETWTPAVLVLITRDSAISRLV